MTDNHPLATRGNFAHHHGTTTTTELQRLADSVYYHLDMHMRPDGGFRYTLRTGPPAWVEALVSAAHDPIPQWDEWRMRFIAEALDALRTVPDPDDIEMDGSTDVVQLGSWFGSLPYRYSRCDQEMANHGDDGLSDTSIRVIMAMGQRNERLEVLDLVRQALEARIATIRADEARAAETEAYVHGLLGLMGP